MAKQPPIRIRKKDISEYHRLAKNTRAKIRRTKKNYGIDLRNDVTIPDLESFQTRDQFNKWKQDQESFTNRANLTYQFRKNDHGVVASKREIQQLERNTRRAQEIAENVRKQTKDKPFISGGKKQGTYGQQQIMLGKPNYGGIYRPPDFDFESIGSMREFNRKQESMQKRANVSHFESRMETMKANYMQKLEETFNSDADPLVKRVEKMPDRDFYEMSMIYDEMDFDYLYTEDDGDFINTIHGYLDRYDRGDVNLDLKLF